MAILPSKAERDAIGIDTYERAILYAAMMLRRSFLIDGEKANLKRLSITSAQAKESNNILIEGEFPYSNSQTWEKGGDFFKPVHYLSLGDPSNSFSPPSPLIPFGNPYINLPSEPAWVETLEEFFIWVLSQSKASLHLESPPRHDVISYRFFDARSPLPIVEVKATLPFNLGIWLRDRHFFNSLQPLLRYSPAIRVIASSSMKYLSTIRMEARILRITEDVTEFTYLSTISSEFKHLKIIRNNLITFVRLSTIASKGSKTTVDESEFNRVTTVDRLSILNKLSKFNVTTTIDVIKSRSNPVYQTSTPEHITEITSDEQILKTDLLVGGWKAKVTIEIKPDLVEKDLYDYPLFIHPENIRKVFDLFVGKRPNDGTLTVWQTKYLTQSFRAKQSNSELLPIYTATSHKKPDSANDFDEYTPEYYTGGIWILLPFLSSNESTFIDLYFLDLFQDDGTGTFGSNKTYPLNRANVFTQYHWWSFYTTEETDDDPLGINLGTATIFAQQDFGTNNNTNSANKRYDLATDSNTNNHPFTVQSASFLSFVDLAQGELTTNPINLTPELTTPTLQAWQIGETFSAIEFGNLVLTSGDVTKASVNNKDSRKISLTKDGGYFNDTFHNPRTIAPETAGSSPELRLGVDTDFSNFYLYNQIKLHKKQLSFEWIKTEYNNEINRSQFYEVGKVKYLSVSKGVTSINSSETIETVSALQPLYHYPMTSNFVDINSNVVLDNTANNYDLTIGNSNGLTINDGLKFTQSNYLEEQLVNINNLVNDYTFVCSMFVASTNTRRQSIINTRVGGSAGIFFGIDNDKVRMFLNGALGDITSNTSLQVGNWYMIAFSLDSSDNAKIYLNENLDASTTFSGNRNSGSPARVGTRANGVNYDYLADNTILKNLLIFDRVLSDDDILFLYNLIGN